MDTANVEKEDDSVMIWIVSFFSGAFGMAVLVTWSGWSLMPSFFFGLFFCLALVILLSILTESDPAKIEAKPSQPAVKSSDTQNIAPKRLAAPKSGRKDDLTRIKGIGSKLEAKLHAMGFYHFEQIANWSAEELSWVDAHLEGFKGRATRDDWVTQAHALMQKTPREGSRG